MRIVTLAALALLATAGESAMAMSLFNSASCNKGMLWPHVRSPGDCLTDAEIAAGMRGTYNGPTETNPNVQAVTPPPQPVQNAPAIAGADGAVPVSGQMAAPVIMQAPGAGVAGQVQAAPQPGMQTVTEFSCHKGLLWPFRRSAGDCLTTTEKRRGMTGVYGGGTGLVTTQVPVQQAAPQIVYQQVPAQPGQQVIYQQVPAAQPAPQAVYQQLPAQPGQQVIYQQVPAAQPGQQVVYQQVPGQQPTPQVVYAPQVQGQPGQQVVYQTPDGNMQTVTVQAAPPPQAAGVAHGCTKGPLWPFIKKPGDCESSSIRARR